MRDSNQILFTFGERPVGSEKNNLLLDYIQQEMVQMEYDVISLPFDCFHWQSDESCLQVGDNEFQIYPGPFSKPFLGKSEIVQICSLDDLENSFLNGKILLLLDEMTREPLMPMNFPFYYPDEHKNIIDKLIAANPLAIIAATGKHPMCGLEPFPLFEDGNFPVPSAYMDNKTAEKILAKDSQVHININSSVEKSKSRQIIATKVARQDKKGKIIICAHMDTKHNTPGALDNATGLFILLHMMKNLKHYQGCYDIDFVPFNGEEYYEVKGQLEYLNYIETQKDTIKLVINIDSPGHKDSQSAISFYNLEQKFESSMTSIISEKPFLTKGEPWVAGDHSMFAFQNIPCLAVTSSNLVDTVMELTHTENDTAEHVDVELLKKTADVLVKIVKRID